MRLQYRILKRFVENNLVEVCYLFWQKDPKRNPQEAELEDADSVRWKLLGVLLIPDDQLMFIKEGNVITDYAE